MTEYISPKSDIIPTKNIVKCKHCGKVFAMPKTMKRAKCPNPECDKFVRQRVSPSDLREGV